MYTVPHDLNLIKILPLQLVCDPDEKIDLVPNTREDTMNYSPDNISFGVWNLS